MTTKLQQYEPTENYNVGPICGNNNWAAGLLGLRSGGLAIPHRPQQSLEVEFDTYLSDTAPSSTLLEYWQVSS